MNSKKQTQILPEIDLGSKFTNFTEFYKFFKKYFVAQETIDLNMSWPSNFFRKYFMAPLIIFSFVFKAFL